MNIRFFCHDLDFMLGGSNISNSIPMSPSNFLFPLHQINSHKNDINYTNKEDKFNKKNVNKNPKNASFIDGKIKVNWQFEWECCLRISWDKWIWFKCIFFWINLTVKIWRKWSNRKTMNWWKKLEKTEVRTGMDCYLPTG